MDMVLIKVNESQWVNLHQITRIEEVDNRTCAIYTTDGTFINSTMGINELSKKIKTIRGMELWDTQQTL